MRFANIANYFSNSKELLNKFGEQIINAASEVKAPKKFINDVRDAMDANIKFTDYGPKAGIGSKYEKRSTAGPFATAVAGMAGRFLSDEDRYKGAFRFNTFRMASDFASKASERMTDIEDGMGSGLSPSAALALKAGIPIVIHSLTETSGPITQGLRPKGYKAVAPKSKEEDPLGKTPRNLAEETLLRFYGGQKSQPLPYKEFIKERPDVMPSTIADYKRYMNRKPEAGKRIDIDPEKQTFTAFGGVVRGTARGLNDPEIRIKGAPITASAALGTAAGLGTISAGVKYLNPSTLGIQQAEKTIRDKKIQYKDLIDQLGSENPGGMGQELVDKARKGIESAKQGLEDFKKIRFESLSPAAKQFEKLGAFKEPAILAGGALAAVGTAAIAKKLFQKAEQERIKKEDPLQYKKYKRGDYTKED